MTHTAASTGAFVPHPTLVTPGFFYCRNFPDAAATLRFCLWRVVSSGYLTGTTSQGDGFIFFIFLFFVWPLLSPCSRSLADSMYEYSVLRSKHQSIRGTLCAPSPAVIWWTFSLSAGCVSTAARSTSTQICEDVLLSLAGALKQNPSGILTIWI